MASMSGYSSNGLPYARIGTGEEVLVMFSGSELENKPLKGLALKTLELGFGGLAKHFTVYMLSRKPNLPESHTAKEISDDFAEMIRADIGKPVHVMGISSGGSSALHFGADHPDLLRKLVLAFTGHRMTEDGIRLCEEWRDLALAGNWEKLYESMGLAIVEGQMPDWIVKPMMRTFGSAILGQPKSGMDLAILLEADIKLDVYGKLPKIQVPTLVIGGNKDPFYSQEIMRQTQSCIPNAQIEFLEGGHSAMKSQSKAFEAAVIRFLNN